MIMTPLPANILIVDDNPGNRKVLYDVTLCLGHTPILAEHGRQALKILHSQPIDLVLLDLLMPELDGYQVLKLMKQDSLLRHLPVIIISASQEFGNIVNCIELGADDYLTKPFNPTLLQARIGGSLAKKRLHDQEEHYLRRIQECNANLEEQVQKQVLEITAAQQSVIFAMAKLVEARDLETGEHLHRVAEYCKVLSEKLGSHSQHASVIDDNFIKSIYAASPLHDIGKVGIPDQILRKRGRLTTEEFAIMKTHPTIGADTLREVYHKHPRNHFVRVGIDVAESHHEKWDGSGYPYGLAGEEIPLAGRIITLADVYDALTTQRYYKDAFSHTKSRAIILDGCAKHFDPAVVEAFLAVEKQFTAIRERFAEPEMERVIQSQRMDKLKHEKLTCLSQGKNEI